MPPPLKGPGMSARPESSQERKRAIMQTVEIAAIVVGLLLGPAWSRSLNICYEEEELRQKAQKMLASNYPHPAEPQGAVAHDTGSSSSVDLCMTYAGELVQNNPTNARSLSPWRYVQKNMEGHYPSSYVEAQCLCSGCIMIKNNGAPEMSHDYNSIPILQSRVFLKRELCSNGRGYYLKPVPVEVVVGCTCARPRISS